jgi:hypothetical protein
MDRDVAQMLAMTAARCSKEIGELTILLKENCTEAEYVELSNAIGSAVYELRTVLMGAVFSLAPDLESEFDARLEKFGRSYFR